MASENELIVALTREVQKLKGQTDAHRELLVCALGLFQLPRKGGDHPDHQDDRGQVVELLRGALSRSAADPEVASVGKDRRDALVSEIEVILARAEGFRDATGL